MRLIYLVMCCAVIFLVGCMNSTLTGEFIRDTLDVSQVTHATFPSGTKLDFQEGTVGFSNFDLECAGTSSLRQELVTLWNDGEDARIARLEGGAPPLEGCDSSSEQFAQVTLVHRDQEKTLEDCSGTLQRFTDEAEALLQRCLTAAEYTAKNTDEFAFRYCTEDRECRVVQPISGLNHLPESGEQGCDCSASINERYRDAWYTFRLNRDEGLATSCGSCEPAETARCLHHICVPVT